MKLELSPNVTTDSPVLAMAAGQTKETLVTIPFFIEAFITTLILRGDYTVPEEIADGNVCAEILGTCVGASTMSSSDRVPMSSNGCVPFSVKLRTTEDELHSSVSSQCGTSNFPMSIDSSQENCESRKPVVKMFFTLCLQPKEYKTTNGESVCSSRRLFELLFERAHERVLEREHSATLTWIYRSTLLGIGAL